MMEMKQDLIDRRDDIITQHVKKLEEKEVELGEKQERLEKVSSFLKGL